MKKQTTKDFTDKLKSYACEKGADMVGIAAAELLNEAPEGHRPADFITDATAVIVVAVRQSQTLVKYGRPSSYTRQINSSAFFLDTVLVPAIANYLEDYGYKAVAIPANTPQTIKNFGDISHKHAAVRAGLGEMGLNTLLITHKYGNRVFLASIVTNAPLTCDKPYTGKLCNRCKKCVKVCPVGALDGEGGIDKQKCRPYQQLPPEKFPEAFCPDTFGMKNCWNCRKVCDAVPDLI